jgi:cytochrome c oxidase subunit 2
MGHIDPLEKYWLIAVSAVIGAFIAALVASVVIFGVRLPRPSERIDPDNLGPKTIEDTEFADDKLGVFHMGGNEYHARVLAQTWFFKPRELRVPVGSNVTFFVTSKDVTHGFIIEEHNINLMLIPGEISTAQARFTRPGTYRIICHEYCGSGHHTMIGTIVVE